MKTLWALMWNLPSSSSTFVLDEFWWRSIFGPWFSDMYVTIALVLKSVAISTSPRWRMFTSNKRPGTLITGQPLKYLLNCSESSVADIRITLRCGFDCNASLMAINKKSVTFSRSCTSSKIKCVRFLKTSPFSDPVRQRNKNPLKWNEIVKHVFGWI